MAHVLKKIASALLFAVILVAGASSSALAQEMIHATSDSTQIPVPLYGFNGNVVGLDSWSNKTFLDAAVALDLKAIRYPGGGVGNWWDWQKGGIESNIPDSLEPRQALLNKKSTSPHDLKDLKRLVDASGSDVVYMLNMVTRSVDDQIAMLQAAQKLGLPVHYIELGNEFYTKRSPGHKIYPTPAQYGTACETWIKRIKQQFPNVKIAVIGHPKLGWNKAVLQHAPSADAIVAHIYSSPKNVIDAQGINFAHLKAALGNQFSSFNAESGHIPIWVTEYNILWFANNINKNENNRESSAALHDLAFTWGQALATILMTSEISQFNGHAVPIVLNHNIANTPNFAALDSQDGSFKKFPSGTAMQLWLKTSDGMTAMRKMNFPRLTDDQALGWVFSNAATGKKSFLLANFTGKQISLDLSNMAGTNNWHVQAYAADKNARINNDADIHISAPAINSGQLQLPAYAIATLSE